LHQGSHTTNVSLTFTRSELQPGVISLGPRGSIHCGPECELLEGEIDKLIAEKRLHVILDISHVSTMDSAAIGSVVRSLKKLKAAGGDLRLASPTPVIARSLEQTKVNKIVKTFASTEEAARDFVPTA
jgi:anti-sigma B factor antagonist